MSILTTKLLPYGTSTRACLAQSGERFEFPRPCLRIKLDVALEAEARFRIQPAQSDY